MSLLVNLQSDLQSELIFTLITTPSPPTPSLVTRKSAVPKFHEPAQVLWRGAMDLEARQDRVYSTTAQREERSKAAQEARAARVDATHTAVREYLRLPEDKRPSLRVLEEQTGLSKSRLGREIKAAKDELAQNPTGAFARKLKDEQRVAARELDAQELARRRAEAVRRRQATIQEKKNLAEHYVLHGKSVGGCHELNATALHVVAARAPGSELAPMRVHAAGCQVARACRVRA